MLFRSLISIVTITSPIFAQSPDSINSNLPRFQYQLHDTELDLSGMTLNENEPELKQSIDVEYLLFRNTNLTGFPKEFSSLINVERIIISECNASIDTLLRNLYKFPKLKELSIENTDISELPNEFFLCKKVNNLEFNKSNISIIDNRLSKLSDLETIRILDCRNIRIDTDIRLPNLKELLLVNVPNDLIPLFVQNCPELINYIYSSKSLKNIDSLIELLTKCEKFEYLEIEDCKIKTIPENIIKLKNLRGICFMNCDLTTIPDFLSKMKLEFVDFTQNKITNMDNICNMKYLTDIVLHYNLIESIPAKFEEMRNITTLDLTSNCLRKFPFEKFKNIWSKDPDAEIHINLRGNFIDSLEYFSDTTSRIYWINLSFNNRTLIDSSKSIEEIEKIYEFPLKFLFQSQKYFDYSPPREILNLNFNGFLDLRNYWFTEEEKSALMKHSQKVEF